jgi:transcriptional regulator with XRE-family HTH domain
MNEFNEYLKEQLKDPEFRAEYEALEPEFAIIQAMVEARKQAGVSQSELSKRTGIAQGDISKLESGNGNPSLKTLQRLATAMDMRLKIEFLPRGNEPNTQPLSTI